MQITDLVAIGKLGNKIDENGFIPFIKYDNFQENFLTDIFLIFTDNRVRYVTVIETLKNKVLKIKFDDEYSTQEAIEAGSVKVAIPKNLILQTSETDKQTKNIGKDLIFEKKNIGKIIDVFSNLTQDIFVVKLKEGKEIMIPIVDFYIESNTDNSIIVKNIEGLLTL